MNLSRRSFLRLSAGGILIAAAPAIVRASSLMPIEPVEKILRPSTPDGSITWHLTPTPLLANHPGDYIEVEGTVFLVNSVDRYGILNVTRVGRVIFEETPY